MEYANSSNTIFNLNYTGVVNYYCYDENNNKIDLSFQCNNACFRIDSVGYIYWQSGQFLSGVWNNGEWKNLITNDNGQSWQQSQQIVSFWKNGIWNNGKFYKGQWEQGFFNSGDFYFGYWLDGVFGYNSLIQQNIRAVWHDGYFYGGVFSGTMWENGAFYTNSDKKTYWLVKDKDNYLLWRGGTINDQYSNSAPSQIVYNNGQHIAISGRVSYLLIQNGKYQQEQFVCANAYFNISTIGNIVLHKGNYYNGKFIQVEINNSSLNGFQLQNCNITNSNISQSTLLNCTVYSNDYHNISNCQWYNGQLRGLYFIDSIWYDGTFNSGTFEKSIWYNGQWNKNKNHESYWESNSQWYGGVWYGGYVDYQWSDISPYIIGNGKTYDMFTGQLLYKYKSQNYVIQLTNAGISIDVDGKILFVSGVWENGQFNDGSFINGQFKSGIFNNGVFQNSIWNSGEFNNGTFYTSVWNDGTFYNGVFERSDWYGGFFVDGTFKSGNWYAGTFNGGDWQTLNSFWFDGIWVNGTQNGKRPSNQDDNFYVTYLTNNDLENNIYVVQLISSKFVIYIYDKQDDKIQLQVVNSYEQCNNIGYYIKQSKLYLCFKNQISDYYKLKYQYVLEDYSPKIQFIDEYLQYLNKDAKNLITGQFTYIVEQDENKQYYTIRVENANFNIQNGFITWNNGIFKDGIWYNGEWNTNSSQFFLLLEPVDQDLMLQLQQCIWQNGIWMNGNWNYQQSKWLNGEWISGTINQIVSNQPPKFQLGNGKNYTNYHGLVKYIYTDEKENRHFGFMQLKDADFQIQSDGYIKFNKGNLVDCYWYNGQWYGDNWYNGEWHNGIWHCGIWHNGIWQNGTWKFTIVDTNDIDRVDYKQGDYRTVGVRYVESELDIPNRGFFIGETTQYDSQLSQFKSSYSSNSDSSYDYFDEWTDQQYQSFYGNKLNQDQSSNSSNSSSSYQGTIAVLVKQWVDSKWKQGFIKEIKSYYPPMYGVANDNEYKDYTQDLVYHYPIYDEFGNFLYRQYFFIQCQNASFYVDKNGYIYWYAGVLLNGQWKDGEWFTGIFVNSIWHNGIWRNGQFASGTFKEGIWYNGQINTENLTWQNGQWINGYINGMKSQCSPNLFTANNHLFVNYTGTVKYYNVIKIQYYKIQVQNACFFVSSNGEIVFYNGTWVDGTFIGRFQTAQLDTNQYNYLLQQKIIQMNKVYSYQKGSKTITYKINMLSNMFEGQSYLCSFLLDSNGKQQEAKFFVNRTNYISKWLNGNFADGIWYNGQWVDGQWFTDDQNNPIGQWITGVINGTIQTQPPSYSVISDEKDYYHFTNFSGRVKYKVNFFNDQTQKISSYLTTFSCKNAFFDVFYQTITKQDKTFRQITIKWYDGTWNNGTWHRGVWKNGTWNNGTWETGYWLNGTWNNGDWISGMWYNGTWHKGQRKQMSILNMIYY